MPLLVLLEEVPNPQTMHEELVIRVGAWAIMLATVGVGPNSHRQATREGATATSTEGLQHTQNQEGKKVVVRTRL
jgi:hypothetical protein